MNLQETINALVRVKTEQYPEGVTVAIALGEHWSCNLSSNCPIAIQLRRMIMEMGITFLQLLEGLEVITAPEPVSCVLPEIDGIAKITIAGQTVELNFNDVIKGQIQDITRHKMQELDVQANRIRSLGDSLYRTYLAEIDKTRTNHVLPQLKFSVEELIKYNFYVTVEKKAYIFISPVIYHPEYIVSNGIRYELSEEDKRGLRRDAYMQFAIASKKFLSIILLDSKGVKFNHYHGRRGGGDYDCWGSITLPKYWDETLVSLHNIKSSLVFALTTINYDSLMSRAPDGMPDIQVLLDRSTELGREGEIKEREHISDDISTTWNRAHWGRR